MYYDVNSSVAEARKMVSELRLTNYRDKLKEIQDEMSNIMKEAGNQESNLPLGSKYFYLRNVYQYINAYFTRE